MPWHTFNMGSVAPAASSWMAAAKACCSVGSISARCASSPGPMGTSSHFTSAFSPLTGVFSQACGSRKSPGNVRQSLPTSPAHSLAAEPPCLPCNGIFDPLSLVLPIWFYRLVGPREYSTFFILHWPFEPMFDHILCLSKRSPPSHSGPVATGRGAPTWVLHNVFTHVQSMCGQAPWKWPSWPQVKHFDVRDQFCWCLNKGVGIPAGAPEVHGCSSVSRCLGGVSHSLVTGSIVQCSSSSLCPFLLPGLQN